MSSAIEAIYIFNQNKYHSPFPPYPHREEDMADTWDTVIASSNMSIALGRLVPAPSYLYTRDMPNLVRR